MIPPDAETAARTLEQFAKDRRTGMNLHRVTGAELDLIDACLAGAHALRRQMEREAEREMPEICAGDVVDLDGFQLRPVFAKSIRSLQGNDGVRAIYRAIWKRALPAPPVVREGREHE